MITLSVIIPIYNLEDYLEECLESIIRQKIDSIEVILVNNASTDRSAAICDLYKSNYEYIKVVHLSENILPAGARNKGLDIAIGEFIHFCDGDDYYLGNVLNDYFNSYIDENVSVLIGQFECAPEKGAYVTADIQLDELIVNNCEASHMATYLLSLPTLLCTPWRLVVRRQLLLENKLYFPEGNHSEDEEWFPKVVCLAKNFRLIKQPFYCYRPRAAGSVTSEKTYINTRSHLIIAIHLLKFYFEQNYNDSRNELILSRVKFLMGLFSTRCDILTNQQIHELNDILIKEDFELYNKSKDIHPLFEIFIEYGVNRALHIYKLQVTESTIELVKGKHNKQIYLIPTGYNGEATLRILQKSNYSVKGFLDNSQSKNGVLVGGILVSLPQIINNLSEDKRNELFIIICNQQLKTVSILKNQLLAMGLNSEQITEKIY